MPRPVCNGGDINLFPAPSRKVADVGSRPYSMIAALHARMSGHPVRLFLTREEAFLSVGNRPAHKMTVKARIKEDGILTAVTPVRMLNLLSERLSRPKSAHFQFVENELKIMDTAPFMVGPPACEPAKKTAAQP